MRSQTSNRYYNTVLQTRSFCAFLIVLALLVTTGGPRPASAVSATTQHTVFLQTDDVPFLPGTFQIINNGSGAQYHPHVECGLASYTSQDQGDSKIHYQDLSTGVDTIVPGNDIDFLSDVPVLTSPSRKLFCRIIELSSLIRFRKPALLFPDLDGVTPQLAEISSHSKPAISRPRPRGIQVRLAYTI